jgi:hypothetical protein
MSHSAHTPLGTLAPLPRIQARGAGLLAQRRDALLRGMLLDRAPARRLTAPRHL